MKELWVDIPGFERYQLSNLGRLRSIGARKIKGGDKDLKIATRGKRNRPYKMVVLYCPQRKKTFSFTVHRLLYELFVGPIPVGYTIDHADGDSLNNELSNLRLATYSQNNINKATARKLRGVFRVARKNGCYWQAKIQVNSKGKHLGYFATEEEAARAYNEAAITHHGEFARINTLDG